MAEKQPSLAGGHFHTKKTNQTAFAFLLAGFDKITLLLLFFTAASITWNAKLTVEKQSDWTT